MVNRAYISEIDHKIRKIEHKNKNSIANHSKTSIKLKNRSYFNQTDHAWASIYSQSRNSSCSVDESINSLYISHTNPVLNT